MSAPNTATPAPASRTGGTASGNTQGTAHGAGSRAGGQGTGGGTTTSTGASAKTDNAAKALALQNARNGDTTVRTVSSEPHTSFSQEIQNFAVSWEPVVAIVFFVALILLMWRTLKVMPRVKPQR